MLNKRPFGEADLIVDSLLENGRIESAFAVSARRSKKRFPHRFHIAAIYELEWVKSTYEGQMRRLQRFDLLEYFPSLVGDLELLSRWMNVLEWVWKHEKEQHDFQRITQLLRSLSEDRDVQNYHQYFLSEVRAHGFSPELESCVVCGRAVSMPAHFSFSEGGVTHPPCEVGVELTEGLLEFLRLSLQQNSMSEVRLSSEELGRLDEISLAFLEYQLGCQLKSRSFLQELRAMEAAKPSSGGSRPESRSHFSLIN